MELMTRFLLSIKRCIRIKSPSMSAHFRPFIRISMRYPPRSMIKSLRLYYTIIAQIMKDISVRKKTVVFFIQFQLAYIANHLYTINITFFSYNRERCALNYGYIRISTKFQNVERQERNIRLMCPDPNLVIIKEFLLVAHRIGLSGGDIIPDLCLEIISILIRFPEWPVMRMME